MITLLDFLLWFLLNLYRYQQKESFIQKIQKNADVLPEEARSEMWKIVVTPMEGLRLLDEFIVSQMDENEKQEVDKSDVVLPSRSNFPAPKEEAKQKEKQRA